MVLLDGEFNYEFNGSLGSENGARTKKLGPKRKNEKNEQNRPLRVLATLPDRRSWLH